jgi:hypothetical protein
MKDKIETVIKKMQDDYIKYIHHIYDLKSLDAIDEVQKIDLCIYITKFMCAMDEAIKKG